MSSNLPSILVSLEFEVYGKVQGVFFRKHTVAKCKELGLRGWCRNTTTGTVMGTLEGRQEQVKVMKQWLEKVGSPKSNIIKAEFRKQKLVSTYTFSSFDIRK